MTLFNVRIQETVAYYKNAKLGKIDSSLHQKYPSQKKKKSLNAMEELFSTESQHIEKSIL